MTTATKSDFTVDYRCSECQRGGIKLWRLPNGAKDRKGRELLCAPCLAPAIRHGTTIDCDGKMPSPWGRTDQVCDWIPAVPSSDTFWGYTSVPREDVEWWRHLPTWPKEDRSTHPPQETGGSP